MSKVTELRPNLREELGKIIDNDPALTQEAAGRQIGTSGTTISRYLKGDYAGNVSELERKISNWLRTYKQRTEDARALPNAPDWVATPSAEQIMGALEYAQLAGDVVVIYGGAGTGKTETLDYFGRTRPNVWVITATPATAGVVPALEAVAEAVDIHVANGAARLHRAVVKRLAGTFGLLAIDEAQNLSTQALDQMRSIHDATGCGLALLGNEKVYSSMTGGNRAAYLDRLYSRVGKKLRLTKVGNDDVDAIIDAWDVELKGCRRLLRSIAASKGGLRNLTKVMRLSHMYAAGDQREVSCSDVAAAWKRIGGAA